MEKTWAGTFFPHPNKWKHQPYPVINIQCTYKLCFLGGGEKLGRRVLSPPWKVKALTLCRWLSGWRKPGLDNSFPSPASESINLTLSWTCIQPLLFRWWGKTWPARSFPTLKIESINLVQMVIWVEKTWAGPFFPHPNKWKHQPYPVMNTHTFAFYGVGKNWAGPFFPHPDKIKHQHCADGYPGGEKLSWSILFPPWQVKASTLPCPEYTTTFVFQGVGKHRAGPFFPHPEKMKHQPCADGYRDGEKLGHPFFPNPDKWKHQPYSVMNRHTTITF